jgi:hypothetical protein
VTMSPRRTRAAGNAGKWTIMSRCDVRSGRCQDSIRVSNSGVQVPVAMTT